MVSAAGSSLFYISFFSSFIVTSHNFHIFNSLCDYFQLCESTRTAKPLSFGYLNCDCNFFPSTDYQHLMMITFGFS